MADLLTPDLRGSDVNSASARMLAHYMSEADYELWWMARIRAKSTIDLDGCWVWNGWCNYKGYGYTTYRSQSRAIHRRVYEITNRIALPTEVFVCHKCDTRPCWRPDHLFLGDAEANNNDCASKGRHHNTVKTHCKRGHEYTPENTYVSPEGLRNCRICTRERSLRRYYANKQRESV